MVNALPCRIKTNEEYGLARLRWVVRVGACGCVGAGLVVGSSRQIGRLWRRRGKEKGGEGG